MATAGYLRVNSASTSDQGITRRNNDKGQSTVPAGLSGVVAIAAGGEHTVALKLPE